MKTRSIYKTNPHYANSRFVKSTTPIVYMSVVCPAPLVFPAYQIHKVRELPLCQIRHFFCGSALRQIIGHAHKHAPRPLPLPLPPRSDYGWGWEGGGEGKTLSPLLCRFSPATHTHTLMTKGERNNLTEHARLLIMPSWSLLRTVKM